MIKAIFSTLYFDINNFFTGYFLKAGNYIVEDFFLKLYGFQKISSQRPLLIFIKWPYLFLLFIVYGLVLLIWISLPISVSLLIYYGRLF